MWLSPLFFFPRTVRDWKFFLKWSTGLLPLRYSGVWFICHLGIVLPPYETTHEVSVDGHSCLSNFMSIWHTYLKISYSHFSHISLEMPIQAPKMVFLGDFGPINTIIHHRDPQKGTSLRKSASFKLSTVKIHWGVWPVGELTESVTDTHTDTHR